ncbi:MAG: hypothetical protein J0647_09870, partial [Campylobacteraceae bacterium]|nr:hypothetical protein [Campylobacteraceae bacterium]
MQYSNIQEISKIYQFVKKYLAVFSFIIFALLSLLDLYIFTETFHMSSAIFFNRLVSNAFSSFGQFGFFIAIPIVFTTIILTTLYIIQFLFLDISVKTTRYLIVKYKKQKHIMVSLIIASIFAIFGDSFFLGILSRFNFEMLLMLFLLYMSLIFSSFFAIALITQYIKKNKKDSFLDIKILGALFCYLIIKVLISALLLPYIELPHIGIFITLNTLF